jgi:phosphotransferase system HPr (HPr) family protein
MDKHPIERRKVVVALKNGLHVRPMSLIVQAAGKFPGDVNIRRDDGYAVNAKSMFDLLTLKAEHGMQLMLEARGEGAKALLDQLENLFDSKFGWDEDEEEFAERSASPAPRLHDPCPQPVEGE